MIHDAWQSFLERESDPPPSGGKQSGHASAGSAGVAWLPDLGVAAFEGPDVRRFLQGYLTCDTADLGDTRLLPAAICSLKGRVVVNGWCVAPAAEQVLFVIHRSLFDTLAKMLQVYLRFSKTRLEDRSDALLVLAGTGLDAGASGLVIDATRRLFLCDSVEAAAELWRAHPHLSAAEWQARLIDDGIPLVSAATSDAFLPQMLNLPRLGAIDFDKGCYLGQEVVARAQHRGQVKRQLLRLAWTGSASPEAGAELLDADGRARAVIVQAAGGPNAGTALAVVQDETRFPLHLNDGTEFTSVD
jgi:folate-binding protein YgfZ